MVAGMVAMLVLAFCVGWKVAGWQRDSVDLVISRSVDASVVATQRVASESGRKLEQKLDEIQNAPPREIRTEIIKPVFSSVCLSAEFVSMYNDAVSTIERTLSGKPENEMSGAITPPYRNAGK